MTLLPKSLGWARRDLDARRLTQSMLEPQYVMKTINCCAAEIMRQAALCTGHPLVKCAVDRGLCLNQPHSGKVWLIELSVVDERLCALVPEGLLVKPATGVGDAVVKDENVPDSAKLKEAFSLLLRQSEACQRQGVRLLVLREAGGKAALDELLARLMELDQQGWAAVLTMQADAGHARYSVPLFIDASLCRRLMLHSKHQARAAKLRSCMGRLCLRPRLIAVKEAGLHSPVITVSEKAGYPAWSSFSHDDLRWVFSFVRGSSCDARRGIEHGEL
ncbi:MAG TPA: hypothetical protein PLP17_05610, partial [Oligoflexia bacterium]|nr:hypothetical protein [Oligoflexia bacterium]